jgi:hypothetical protein
MRYLYAILTAAALVFPAFGGVHEILVTTGTNYADTVTGFADPFTGDVEEVAVYTVAGVTGAVSIAALDPFSGAALVLATNASVTGFLVFTPRVLAADFGGSAALTVTNTATADPYRAEGERLFATVTGVSENATNSVFRFRLKTK